MLHALGMEAGRLLLSELVNVAGGISTFPKVRIFQKCLNFTPMNDTTVRPFMYLQVVKKGDLRCYLCGGPACYPSEQQQQEVSAGNY